MNALLSIILSVFLLSSAFAQSAPTDSVSVADLGIYGDGQTEQSDTIQAVLDSYSRIYFPPGRYAIDKSLNLRNNHHISGTDSTVFLATGEAATAEKFSFVTLSSVEKVRLDRLTFYANDHPKRRIYAVAGRNVHGLTLKHLKVYNAGVVQLQEKRGYSYAKVPSDLSSEAFRQVGNSALEVTQCHGEGSQYTIPRTTAVYINYTDGWKVTQSSFTRYHQGVRWWGGDSDTRRDGALANVRKCRNGLVSEVQSSYIHGGGIWGSMGEDITVQHCQVSHCQDVGIDFEGCFRSKAINNYVAECKNGNLAVFFFNKDITFTNNQSVQSNPNYRHACIYNASQRQDNGKVVFDQNTFSSTQGVGKIEQRGPSRQIIFTQNSLQNVVVNFSFNNNKQITVQNNTFLITRPLTHYDFLLKAGQTHRGGKINIEGNHLLTTVPQADNVYAISLYQSDYNSSPVNRVINNYVSGLSRVVKTEWAGKNAGFRATTYVESEASLSPEAIKKIDVGARSSKLYVNDKEQK